ncbi:MAG TPA: hypothetical protein VN688_28320, partial [Gemmataceae bacterium]|nr:hypothetical protein [Gemmataceae bacterium]
PDCLSGQQYPDRRHHGRLNLLMSRLAEPLTVGAPMSDAKFVRRSLRTLSDELVDQEHAAPRKKHQAHGSSR